MWSVVRSTAARQLRVSRAVKQTNSNSFIIPSAYRLAISRRNFTETSGELAPKSAATAAKPKAKATKTLATAKKPAEKKSKAATTKSVAKAKKPKAKKKKAVKAAPKKRVRKVLTPEEKRKAEVRELKKTALLKEPKKLPDRTWLVYMSQHLKGEKNVTEAMKQFAEAYKSLSASEIERLDTTATQNRLANQAAHKAWVESHTPVEIDAANRARRRLRRIGGSTIISRKPEIKDDRQPVKPLTGYTMFTVERWQSGDYAGQAAMAVAPRLAQEWKSLSASQRKAFEDSSLADRERYAKAVQSTLHREVKSRSPSA